MAAKEFSDRTPEEIAGYVLTAEENEQYSDEDLRKILRAKGAEGLTDLLILYLRGIKPWTWLPFIE